MGFFKYINKIFKKESFYLPLISEMETDFCLWAFGISTEETAIKRDILMNLWNVRHGDKLILNSQGLVREDINRMRELYIKEKNIEPIRPVLEALLKIPEEE